MSLVSMISGKSERCLKLKNALESIKPMKEEFSTFSGKKPFSKEYELKVKYNLENPYQSTLIGTAFDYLARFIISKYTFSYFDVDNLIAFKIAEPIHEIIDEETSSKLKHLMKNGEKHIKTYCKEQIFSIKNNTFYYDINKLSISRELAVFSIKLAKLDGIYRGGLAYLDNTLINLFNEESEVIIEELMSLCEIFIKDFIDTDLINPRSKVIFNPTFNKASDIVGGADADIIIDKTLYDFKTTKNYGYMSKNVLQLMGYYILNKINQDEKGFFRSKTYSINRIAFYKARFGEVEYFDISKLDKSKILTAKKCIKSL
ncbi:hypothetical protein GNF78_13425 [Clostridium perfringens]|uniref:hypothetical protein n=1 Tax=Clostridium perfringens TaxID=1502 RepID=UPI002AC70844|nr:hypothetical protein [Clostridium perfringens]MDZ5038222.1 hypothetical protein [Clostridium perfringens]